MREAAALNTIARSPLRVDRHVVLRDLDLPRNQRKSDGVPTEVPNAYLHNYVNKMPVEAADVNTDAQGFPVGPVYTSNALSNTVFR